MIEPELSRCDGYEDEYREPMTRTDRLAIASLIIGTFIFWGAVGCAAWSFLVG